MARRPRARARLLVLGAGPAQLGLLEAARARSDVHVIAVDRDPQAIGFPLADERAIVSTEDEEAVERLARARDVDGVVSPGADWPVAVAARVAARLGLAHPIDPPTAAVATSKLRQRDKFAAAGVPHARAVSPDDGELRFPCVVKAPDRQGQRGLTLVRDEAELEAALALAATESRSGAALLEEHVDGPEVTVNAFSCDGAFTALTVTDRLTAEPPAFGVALAHVWPSTGATNEAVDVARRAVEAVGIRNGPSYTQLRLGPDGPVVMEVAARLGGGHDAELCRAALGVDLDALTVEAALRGHACDDQLQAALGARAGARGGMGAGAPPGAGAGGVEADPAVEGSRAAEAALRGHACDDQLQAALGAHAGARGEEGTAAGLPGGSAGGAAVPAGGTGALAGGASVTAGGTGTLAGGAAVTAGGTGALAGGAAVTAGGTEGAAGVASVTAGGTEGAAGWAGAASAAVGGASGDAASPAPGGASGGADSAAVGGASGGAVSAAPGGASGGAASPAGGGASAGADSAAGRGASAGGAPAAGGVGTAAGGEAAMEGAATTAAGGAAVVFLVPPRGRLVAVEGIEDAEAQQGVEWVRLYRRPGHVFGTFLRGSDRAGAVLATGADREEALARARRAADAVRFRVDADAP